MKVSVVVVIVLAMLFINQVSASGQDAEPAAGVQASAEDPRLDQKITYRCEAKRLDEMLPEIARQTGVVIGVDPSKRFWSVRQRKVTLFIKDMPLREFMEQLEALLDYHFSRQGKPGEYTYTLWQDVRGRSREQAILKAQAEMRDQHRRLAIEETLRDAELALAMSPEEAKAIEEKNPWLAYLAGNPRGRAYAELLRAVPEQHFRDMTEGSHKSVNIALDELHPRGSEAVQQIWSMVNVEQVRKDYDHVDITPTSVSHLWLHDNSSPRWSPSAGAFWLHVFVEDAAVDNGRKIIADSFKIIRTDAPVSETPEVARCNDEEMRARMKRSNILQEADWERRKLPQGLELTADYPETPSGRDKTSLATDLQLLADLFHLQVIHEHFPEFYPAHQYKKGERRLTEVLGDIQSRYYLDWEATGQVLRFRHFNWAERRSWEISPEWIAYWLGIIELKGRLDLDALADMASRLTDAQIESNFQGNSSSIDDPALVKVFRVAGADQVTQFRLFLESYGRLPTTQKSMLWSANGLSLAELAGESQDYPSTIGDAPIYDGRMYLYSRQNPDTNADETYWKLKFWVWLRDLSDKYREMVLPTLTQDTLALSDNEPVVITPFRDQLLLQVDREKVKLALEEWRKAKAAAKKAEQARQSADAAE